MKDEALATRTKQKQQTQSTGSPNKIRWVLDDVEMCDDFFRTVFGISKDKLKGVRLLLKDFIVVCCCVVVVFFF